MMDEGIAEALKYRLREASQFLRRQREGRDDLVID